MTTWFLGILMVYLFVEVLLGMFSTSGGPLSSAVQSTFRKVRESSRAGRWLVAAIPTIFFFDATVGWLYQFPTQLVMEGAIEPYQDVDYLVPPLASDAGFLEGLRVRFAVALYAIEESLATAEKAVQPLFVTFASGLTWLWANLAWIVVAVGVLEVLFLLLRKRGPLTVVFGGMFNPDARLGKTEGALLRNLLFILIAFWYFSTAFAKEAENARQKIMPLLSDIVGAFRMIGVESNQLWVDTLATSIRFGIAITIVALAIPFGIAMAKFPRWDALLSRFTLWGADKVNPFAIMILVFIILKTGEHTRILLAVLAVAPTVALDACLRARELPSRLIEKTRTFAATNLEVPFRRVLKMIFPGVLNTIRLNIKVIIGILIFSETIGGREGLGLRISLAERHTYTSHIIVMNVMFLIGLILVDTGIRVWIQRSFRWYGKS